MSVYIEILCRSSRLKGTGMMKQFQVLVVDDEPRIIAFLKVKLKATGYDVLTATNGFEALEQVADAKSRPACARFGYAWHRWL